MKLHVQLYTYIIHVPGTEEEDYYYLGVHNTTMVLYNLQSTISLMMLGKWVVETIQLPIVHIPRWYLVLSLSCHDKNSEHR